MAVHHTIVISDLHLTEVEEPDPARPLWKRYKHADLQVDDELGRLLEWLMERVGEGAELILAGDVFDFDAVVHRPEGFRTSWLERRRGLAPEQAKSRWKIERILDHHPGFVRGLRRWLEAGHEVVFIIGNHDLELHWQAVQDVILEMLGVEESDAVRFCEWFTLSGSDTLVEHGNQYDRYCLAQDPIHPLVGPSREPRVRLPFGDLAGKLMLNGMGLFNPHVENTFIKDSSWEYLVFFYKYVLRVQPLLLLVWAWSALATLLVSLREGFLPALRDPVHYQARVEAMAERSRVPVGVLTALHQLRVHPAIFNPWMIARELWLDRAILLVLVLWGSFQIWSTVNAFHRLSFAWFGVPLALLLPPFLFYAGSVHSQVAALNRALTQRAPVAASIAGVKRVILGHTHLEEHTVVDGVELVNTGTWSPAFEDPECTRPFGRRCFAWLTPGPEGRSVQLHQWLDPGTRVIEPRPPQELTRLRDRLRSTLTGLPLPGRRG